MGCGDFPNQFIIVKRVRINYFHRLIHRKTLKIMKLLDTDAMETSRNFLILTTNLSVFTNKSPQLLPKTQLQARLQRRLPETSGPRHKFNKICPRWAPMSHPDIPAISSQPRNSHVRAAHPLLPVLPQSLTHLRTHLSHF